jgi:hypothetical protein
MWTFFWGGLMEKSHYNGGHVWGRVEDTKEEESKRSKPFLNVQLHCYSTKNGNVYTYGRIWGRERIDKFLAQLQGAPGALFRFWGFFSQYESRGEIKCNYTFWKWALADQQKDLPRAAFVLRGDLVKIDRAAGKFSLHLSRKGQEGYEDIEEDFDFWVRDPAILENREVGDLVNVKGYLSQEEGEDEYGSTFGPIRPYADRVDVDVPF